MLAPDSSPRRFSWPKACLISIFIANVTLLPLWQGVLVAYGSRNDYYRKGAASPALLLAAILATFAVSGVVFTGLSVAMAKARAIGRGRCELVIVCICFTLLVARLPWLFPVSGSVQLAVCAGAAAVMIVCLLLAKLEALIEESLQVLAVLSVLFPILVFSSVTSYSRGRNERAEPYRAAEAGGTTGHPDRARRLVWILFDELDYAMSFEERPATLPLPEFDRLRKVGLLASNAHPVGDSTRTVVPSYLLGEQVSYAEELGGSGLNLHLLGRQESVRFDQEPNLFDKLRPLGVRSAVAGWFYPYCRTVGRSLDACYWQPAMINPFAVEERLADRKGVTRSVGMILLASPALIGLTSIARSLESDAEISSFYRQQHAAAYEEIHQRALQFVADPTLGLVFLHYNIPHPPGIYDLAGASVSAGGGHNYLDNLALADRTLNELRSSIAAAGLDGRTAILITSDHSFRPAEWRHQSRWIAEPEELLRRPRDPRVVFLLHLPGQTAAVRCGRPFNAILAYRTVLDYFAGRLSNQKELVRWLDDKAPQFLAQAP